MSRQDGRDVVLAAVGFGYGIWAFFHGFNRLRRLRLIENLPTSTVRGLAMGLVELEGVVRPTAVLRSPLTDTECAMYQFKVEEYRRSGKSGRWVTIAQGNSFFCPFYLEDATGKIKVYPAGAEIVWEPAYRFKSGLFKDPTPGNLIRFMEKHNINNHGWIGEKSMRFTEWYMRDGFPVYALGTAQREDGLTHSQYNEILFQRLEELRKDKERFKKLDTDKDGRVSDGEWAQAVVDMESALVKETMKDVSADNASGIRIARSVDEKVFIISDTDQRKLVDSFFMKCMWCIWGGPILSLATLAYLIWRLSTMWNF